MSPPIGIVEMKITDAPRVKALVGATLSLVAALEAVLDEPFAMEPLTNERLRKTVNTWRRALEDLPTERLDLDEIHRDYWRRMGYLPEDPATEVTPSKKVQDTTEGLRSDLDSLQARLEQQTRALEELRTYGLRYDKHVALVASAALEDSATEGEE